MLSVDQQVLQAASLREQGKIEEAISLLETARNSEPDRADIHFNLGLNHDQLGEALRAAECFRQAVCCRPQWVDAHIYMIAYTTEAGDPERAISLLEEAFKLSPDNKSLHDQLAIALGRRSRSDAAVQIKSMSFSFRIDGVAEVAESSNFSHALRFIQSGKLLDASNCLFSWLNDNEDAISDFSSVVSG